MSEQAYTVWVGGGEVNSYYLTKAHAESIAQDWIDKGYDDVVIEKVEGQVIGESECSECKEVINWDEGGFIWEGLAFCELHDPKGE